VKADLDEMSTEARLAEEKAQHCMVDAARLADELRAEQVRKSDDSYLLLRSDQ
jgi:hypothetical protein